MNTRRHATQPPRIAAALLGCCLPSDHRDAILGDLAESFAQRCADGRWRARAWYWSQALRLAGGFTRERWTPEHPAAVSTTRARGGDVSNITQDLRFAVRMALKTPWMTGACIVALGAAMAVTIAGFSLVWDAYFAELPFEHADRIVAVRDITQPDPDDVAPRLAVYRQWEQNQSTFDVLAASYTRFWDIADGQGGLARYPVATVTASTFEVAGVPPLHGRTLLPSDQEVGAPPVAVIGHRVWRSLFGGDPDVVGRTIDLDGTERQVVGIMPEGFRFPMSEDLWVPMNMRADADGGVEPRWMRVFGRMTEGTTRQQAEAELDAMRVNYANENPDDIDVRDRVTTVLPYVQADSEQGTEVIFIGAFVFIVLVLAIACASVANLLLARATARTGEIAVRAALGASRRRLITQLFVEALVLTAAGAVLGVVAAHMSLSWFGASVPLEGTPFWLEFGMNPAAAAFSVIAALGAALIAGMVPALKATSLSMHDVLKDEQGTTSSVRFGSISGALTVAEVALSVAFLAAAGLVAQSLVVATDVNNQLPTGEVLVVEMAMADESVFNAEGDIVVPAGEIPGSQWQLVQQQIRAAALTVPGARTAALATTLPGGQHRLSQLEFETAADDPTAGVRVPIAVSSAELFGTFDAQILAGRNFGPEDTLESEPVAIVNAAFARRFFGDQNPVGERFRRSPGNAESPWIRIVGVSSDVRMNPGTEQAAGYYIPFSQQQANTFLLAMRVNGDPLAMSAAVRAAIHGVDERIDISSFETHQERAANFRTAFQIMGLMFSALGGTAFFLSVAGLYAVMAFSVAQRTREIGIRLALGASSRGVLRVVLRRGLLQVGLGLALGSALGWTLLRLMQFIPIGMASTGTGLLALAAGSMLAAGLFACLVPAARALAVHPVDALRHD